MGSEVNWFKIGIIAAAVVVIAVAVLWAVMALAEDYWTSCNEAYAFCKRQPFHRDCSIWTHYNRPLVVTRRKSESQFCKENPWHIACGEVVIEECPNAKRS